jgi:transformation/transcription domain-associated protein
MADTDVTMSDVASGSSVTIGMDWEPIKLKLLDADAEVSLEAAQELRERMEIVHTTEFPRMLASMLPAFSTVLSHLVRPNPDTTTTEHKVRNSVLEVLSRLPNNEVLRPHAAQILAVAMEVLVNDYEDNALLASRIIFDLHKNYRQMPQEQVQPYLDFVLHSYRSLPNSIQNNFRFPIDPNASVLASAPVPSPDTPAAAGAATNKDPKTDQKQKKTPSVAKTPPTTALSPSSGIPTTPKPRLSPKSSASFRVLTECPLTVMLLFQLHPKFLKANIQSMITLMIEALGLRAPPLQQSPGTVVNSGTKRLYHSRSRELVATQVKTLSFLTQFLKGFADLLKPYEQRIADNVVALMTICPPESIGTRRELLHATRHILATDFRRGFFRHVDSLLDERVLMGSHPKSSDQAVLRPLGYSTLADLVHHARSLLSMKQLSRVVYMFSRVVHDSSLKLPLSIQTTAVRLLLNLVDTIFHNKEPNAQTGRDLLARILDSLVRKLGVLKDYIPVVEEAEKLKKEETSDLEAAILWNSRFLSNGSDTSDLTDDSIKSKDDMLTRKLWSQDDASDVMDTLQEVQVMVRSIVVGLKTVIWCVNNYRHQREKEKGRDTFPIPLGSNDEVSSAMHKLTNWEYGLIDKYITYALPCLRVFEQVSTDGKPLKDTKPENILVANQYRDVLTYFAAAFTMLDSFNLRRTLGKRVDLLVDAIDKDHHAMVIPRHLLASNQKASFVFANILLSFLVQHMEELSTSETDQYVFVDRQIGADSTEDCVSKEEVEEAFERAKGPRAVRKKRASTILELFERVLKSLATFPDNEAALRPYLRKIVSTCLRSMMERAEGWPDNNCILLRYTFRAISAGKFEESYKELLPLLPTILNGLYRIFVATDDTNLRHVIIELCLTVPARLSSLLPHMSLLLRMIIHGLNSNTGDLVNLG